MIEEQLKKHVCMAFHEVFGLCVEEGDLHLRRPPNPSLGDMALNCSSFAKQTGRNPHEIAKTLAGKLNKNGAGVIKLATATGAYLNILFNPVSLFAEAVDVTTARNARVDVSERVMVEYMSPNTNKPLHLGHVRNGVLGSSLANILEAVGHFVVKAILANDRGVHICKSMLAWQRFANGATPESTQTKGDHFVGDYYVRFAREANTDATLEQAAVEMLRKWEAGDRETMELWQKMNDWVYAGFEATYSRYGFRFEITYYESDTYLLGKNILVDGLQKGVLERKEDGTVIFPLDIAAFGTNPDRSRKTATLLRNDGTSVYLTQDLGTAVQKVEDFEIDRSVYVVADEQKHHFQVLFAALQALGYPWATKCYHFAYGMVELPSGRMKSREGTAVDADDLADKMNEIASDEIRDRMRGQQDLSAQEIATRAEKIGMAAIKFFLLRHDPLGKICFDPEKSISLEGDTGPYCLYAYARIRSIFQKAAKTSLTPDEKNYSRLGELEERDLALNLLELPIAIQRAAEKYSPAILCEHMLKLAKSFNRFYAQHQVLIESDLELTRQRLALVNAVAQGLQWGLNLLGISTLETM